MARAVEHTFDIPSLLVLYEGDAQSELARTGRELNAAHARLSRIESQLPRRIARRLRAEEGAEAPQ
jgi:hypothetical protein